MSYDFRSIEAKWQSLWEEARTYRAPNPGDADFDPSKPPYYVLDMFPYPSGSGLHVGHASGYIGTDIVARKKRMEGFNVLHPMGWDAFGLPAEQYAIQTNQHPRITTDVNTENFRRQLKLIGLSYDWSRELDTSDPRFYRWTQWIFLRLFSMGLAYRKEVPVWWCEDLKTVLANEEVIAGRSERGNYPCERRLLWQWVFRITAYADRLLQDLDLVHWPDGIKKMQRDWIGKSTGADIIFPVKGHDTHVKVFSTRPDTLYGTIAIVMAPEHALVDKIVSADCRSTVEAYRALTASKSDRERKSGEAITAAFTGAFATHPLEPSRLLPIYIADYVLADYGTGALMAVPAHDERDQEFARVVDVESIPVIRPKEGGSREVGECFIEDGVLVNSGPFSGLHSAEAREKVTAELQRLELGSPRTTYKLRDWIFSRQRYWGEPFPLLIDLQNEVRPVPESDLPVELPQMRDFAPSADGTSPLERVPDWVNVRDSQTGEELKRVTDTMPGWAGSCWYYLRFMDPRNNSEPFSPAAAAYWKQVDLYIGGASHAVMHLLYARFWHKALFDLGLVPTPEPFYRLFNQGMVTGFAFRDADNRLVATDDVETHQGGHRHKTTKVPVERFIAKMSKSLRNVVNPDDVIKQHGADVFRLYEMFVGPLDSDKPWASDGIVGCEKFLRRIWSMLVSPEGEPRTLAPAGQADRRIDQALHRCLDRVNRSFIDLNLNTAVAALMEALNEIARAGGAFTSEQAKFLLKVLSPFAPHIAAEIWTRLGECDLIDYQPWPALDPAHLERSTFELVVQVNGKVRGKVSLESDTLEDEIKRIGREAVASWISDREIEREVYIEKRLLNVVVR